MKPLYFVAIIAALLVSGCGKTKDSSSCPPDCSCVSKVEIEAYYGSSIDEIQEAVKRAFNDAERLVLGNKPKPDAPKGPHEDPDKCICGGSGKIRQGDGHVTPCPFHSGEHGQPRLEVDGEVIYKK